MTFAPVGTLRQAQSSPSLSLNNQGGANLLIVLVAVDTNTTYCSSISGGGATWTMLGSPALGSVNAWYVTAFAGKVTSTGAQTATLNWSSGAPGAQYTAVSHEYTSTVGAWALDTSALLDRNSSGGTNTCPSLTPAGSGELYFAHLQDSGTATSGSTSGYTYADDSLSNGICWNAACTSSAQAPVWGDSGLFFGRAILVKESSATTHSGTATLAGSGTLQGAGAFGGIASLSGSGSLAWSGSRVYKATALSGSGTLTGTVIGTINETVTLSGSGTLSGAAVGTLFEAAALSGSGTLSVPGVKLGFQATLSGTGTLFVIGTGGTVQAAAGASTPYAYPGTSQVAVAPPGTQSWRYLGTLGVVTALTYSFTCPGGADRLTCTVMVPADFRTQLLNPGWQVRVTRGGHIVWTGKMDEPVPGSAGWTLTAVGDGNRGTDFRAVYSGTWPSGIPDDPVNEAIARGLPWVNPGIGSPAGIWTGQAQDSASGTVTDLLNLVCTRGGLTWYANSQPGGSIGTDLSVFPLPTAVNRLLVVTDPVARTLGGDINTIFIRYEISDGVATSTAATFGLTSVQNAASVAAHGVIEDYMDLSSAGVMPAATAQTVGNFVLQVYQRASFAGPFTGSYGSLLNAGGVAIDPGTDQAGTVVRPILTDYGYGGEVSMQPITFITGAYSWDDFAQKFTVTPQAVLDQSLSGLLSMAGTVLTPVTVVA